MRLRHFCEWLIGSKFRLGWILGFAAVLAVAAVVDRPWRARDDEFDAASWRARAETLADSLFGGAHGSWTVVAEVETPWGRSVRIRPIVGRVEIRGCDLVVQPSPATLLTDPSSPDGFFYPAPPSGPSTWSGSASSREVTRTEDGLVWRCRATLSLADRDALARCAAGVELAGSSLTGTGVDLLHWTAQRDPVDGEWHLWAEAMLDPPAANPSIADPNAARPNAEDASAPDARPPDARPPHAWAPDAWAALPWSTEVPPRDTQVPVLMRIDPATGALLEVRDGRVLAEWVGQALVFDPNPVVTSGLGDLRDGNVVDPYRVRVSLPRLDGSGRLRGRWIETRSDRPPLAQEPRLVYDFPSYDPRFEEAMAYYHADRGIERAQARGFGELFRSPIFARVHGSAADNSWYSRPTRELVFGDGGVDDAEDADIILHELGHAIHDALVPGFGEGDTRAISEGFADFWAASLTADPCVGNWDATSYSPPCLRSTENGAAYPTSLTGRPHADGQIWSGVLWDLRESLGEEAAEQLALAAFLEQDPETTWPEAAEGLVRAASRNGDANRRDRVVDALVRRGLLARELAVHLEPGRDWTLRFLSPARFLEQAVGSLHLGGDGTIRFADPTSPPLESAPTVVAAGLGAVENAPLGLALDCTVRIDAGLVTIHQTWRVSTTELVAVRIEWDTVGGALSWTYERAGEGTEPLALFAGASSRPGSDPLGVDWAELPADGIEGVVSCRGSIEEPTEMIGARFTVTPETSSTFRLARTGQPRPSGSGPLLVAFPNPGRDRTAVRLFLDETSVAEVALFDAQGRRVRELSPPGQLGSGLSEWTWDGRDDRGHLLPSGRYWARASSSTGTARIPVILIR